MPGGRAPSRPEPPRCPRRVLEALPPFERVVQPEELWLYRNPFVEAERVPSVPMFFIAFLSPLLLVVLARLFLGADQDDTREACLGRGRTSSIDASRTDERTRSWRAQATPASWLRDAKASPAATLLVSPQRPQATKHVAFAGLAFSAFYLAGKLHCFAPGQRGTALRLCAFLLPLFIATLIALSRTCDYKHHWQDVLVGSVIGFVLAYLCYRQYYPPLTDSMCHKPSLSKSKQLPAHQEKSATSSFHLDI
ncbi:phospholipid phosphatase 5 isoform X4 [Cygnus olor]|uniref:phospholipid phosphatase 5 isoform X4 n=1 Tax=Cygnus olor TaxID=8869 RepID=UPI001ADE3009|nr:phospholipid phosphatase 5 isoform X4 [Cygnus olor]